MQIFPKEIINNTIEVHRFKHQTKSKVIYTILILAILMSAFALPYIFIDIYSSSRGILKSENKRNLVTTLYSGKISSIFIHENKLVQRGDTLLILDNRIISEKLKLITIQLEETNLFIVDLKYLTTAKKFSKDSLYTFLFQKQYMQYRQKLKNLQTKKKKTRHDYLRQKKLFNKEVIAKIELENSRYNYDLILNEMSHFQKQQFNNWQSELTNYSNKGKELQSRSLQLVEEQNNYIITASTSGSIQNLSGVDIGSFVNSGSSIAEISPDTDLIAECYISPSDIGLLKTNNEVKFQIDAFNYNQWGMVTGKVLSISKDIISINNTPMFKVICSLEQKQLQLKNGFEGKLKKGMTLKAQFFIVKRSVFDLLYDTIDDWFKP